ncbi:MAG: hypothetical protein H6Q74_578 [Firmicutes bacterium]|nr:hypothetical protein [Bacillota bacterium]
MANWYGYILMIAAAFFFAASSIVCKYTYATGLNPVTVLILQYILALGISWGWVLVSGNRLLIPKKLIITMLLQGLIGSFLTSVLFFSALAKLDAALATLLLFTYPAIVLIYNAVFTGYSVTRYEKIALVMAIVGLAFCVNLPEISIDTVGASAIGLVLASAVTNAFLVVNGEKLLSKVALPVVTAWSQTISFVAILVVYQPLWMAEIALTWYQIELLVTGGLVLLLPIMLYYAGIKRIGSGISSIISTAEIPLTIIMAWILLGETLNLLQALGGILIMLSVVVLYYCGTE